MKVININIENISGCSYYSKNNVNFWLKGYIINFNNEEIYNRIISIKSLQKLPGRIRKVNKVI